jgi:hypothetical protein
MAEERIWIKYHDRQPFKLSTINCRDVSDLLEAAHRKLNLTVSIDRLHLFIIANSMEIELNPGKMIHSIINQYPFAGIDDGHCLVLKSDSVIEEAQMFTTLVLNFCVEQFKQITWQTAV